MAADRAVGRGVLADRALRLQPHHQLIARLRSHPAFVGVSHHCQAITIRHTQAGAGGTVAAFTRATTLRQTASSSGCICGRPDTAKGENNSRVDGTNSHGVVANFSGGQTALWRRSDRSTRLGRGCVMPRPISYRCAWWSRVLGPAYIPSDGSVPLPVHRARHQPSATLAQAALAR